MISGEVKKEHTCIYSSFWWEVVGRKKNKKVLITLFALRLGATCCGLGRQPELTDRWVEAIPFASKKIDQTSVWSIFFWWEVVDSNHP